MRTEIRQVQGGVQRVRPVPSSIAVKLSKATDLIAEQGLEHTTIEELALATGIPKATLYYHFSGKEEILVILLRDLLAEVAQAVAVAVESPGTAGDRLVAVVWAQLEVMAAHPSAWRALVADLGRAGRLPEIAEAVANAYYNPVQRLLEDGAGDGSLRAVDDAAATSMAIFGATTVTALHHLMAGRRIDVEDLARQVTAFVLGGVSALSSPLKPASQRSSTAS